MVVSEARNLAVKELLPTNKGIKAMFVMMNEARFGVGMQVFGFAG